MSPRERYSLKVVDFFRRKFAKITRELKGCQSGDFSVLSKQGTPKSTENRYLDRGSLKRLY